MTPTLLLLISDAPSCSSGLGRITRDLALRIHVNMGDVFRVACAGYGGPGRASFPFPEYHFHSIDQWQLPELPMIASDFAGDEELIVLFVWDASRVGWFADPRLCPLPHVRRWLETANIRKWIYVPVDAEGPNGGLSMKLAHTLKGFERVLNYTSWSAGVTGYPDHLPHGIDTSIFYPEDKKESKKSVRDAGFRGLRNDSFLIGVVATNQARKDWHLAMATARILVDRGVDVRMWCHTDAVERFWDLGALIHDFGLLDRVVITTSNFNDAHMRMWYSACDVTLGIGLGEGFGYPIFESQACGTACIHGDYGGAAEYISPGYKPMPINYRYEGPYCCKRPIFSPDDWADACCRVESMDDLVQMSSALDWTNLWPKWEKWLKAGIR